jgi:glutathione synthase/RimK-type ligase-like ATP-grasp enzyme
MQPNWQASALIRQEVKIMNYSIEITTYKLNEDTVVINESFARKLKLYKKKMCILGFGSKKNYVKLILSKEIAENEISVSENVIEDLCIPEYLTYEVKVEGNEIILGPCIGILANKKDEGITKARLKSIALNTLSYSRIHGAVIVFALDKVDRAARLIEGYCYNPKNDSWERGIFPYPLAIYRRAGMSSKWMNHFASVMGDAIFSNFSFGKWEMHEWFSEEEDIIPNLPETVIYEKPEDIEYLLDKYKTIYIKPVWGMKGHGVVRVSYDEEKYSLQYREGDENKNIVAESYEDFQGIIEKLFERNNYILQQGLELITYDGGLVDFRCIMQKNEMCRWVCNGIVARIGAQESVVSNISSGGAALPGMELLQEGLKISEEDLFTINEKMISLCTRVCRTLDEYGFNFGTLGLDLGVDKQHNVWLIEVNNRKPHPGIAIRANDIPAYYTILTAPLHYAKGLAGFGL